MCCYFNEKDGDGEDDGKKSKEQRHKSNKVSGANNDDDDEDNVTCWCWTMYVVHYSIYISCVEIETICIYILMNVILIVEV